MVQSCCGIQSKTMKSTVAFLCICFHWLIYTKVQAEWWNHFITGSYYANLKLVTEFQSDTPRYFPKEMRIISVRLECSQYCASNQSCYAFNVYQNDWSYVCELVPDNFCVNRTRKALVDWPGNEIWDKVSTGMSKSCLETQYPPPASIPCAVVKPGCLGTWPNCNNCLKSCKDCYNRTPIFDFYDCTLWPEGPLQMAIFGKCFAYKTMLIERFVNVTTAKNDVMYQMSFYDMKRMQRLSDLSTLEFNFNTIGGTHHWAHYKNFDLDTNGTLLSLTFDSAVPSFDMFQLNSRAPGPIPFVNVTDDRYGCGSFWLLDPSNATYCPGGGVRMLGTLQKNGNQIISNAVAYPTIEASSFIYFTSLELV